MPNITLYHASPSRSSIVLWMLEEVGQPYDIKLIRLSAGDNLKPDYLAVNPMGKVPSLKHGDTVITEGAAICTYLADEFPDRKLNVPVGNTRRGEYLKWLFFGPSVIEPAMTDRAFPRKENPRAAALGWRDFDTVLDIVSKALAKGPNLMGEQFTAADVVRFLMQMGEMVTATQSLSDEQIELFGRDVEPPDSDPRVAGSAYARRRRRTDLCRRGRCDAQAGRQGTEHRARLVQHRPEGDESFVDQTRQESGSHPVGDLRAALSMTLISLEAGKPESLRA